MDTREARDTAQVVLAVLGEGAGRVAVMGLDKYAKDVRAAIDRLVDDERYTDAMADQDTKGFVAGTRGAMAEAVKVLRGAVGRVASWNGSNITIKPHYTPKRPNDPYNPFPWRSIEGEDDRLGAKDATVYVHGGGLEGGSPYFTLFGGKAVPVRERVEDVLDAGDSDFFADPKVEMDYFNLVAELRAPGSTRTSKVVVLWTARPRRDRARYERAKTIPSGIFLTNQPEDAGALARELPGGERDIWRVEVSDKYLVNTLDRGRLQHYQAVAPGSDVPVVAMDLEWSMPEGAMDLESARGVVAEVLGEEGPAATWYYMELGGVTEFMRVMGSAHSQRVRVEFFEGDRRGRLKVVNRSSPGSSQGDVARYIERSHWRPAPPDLIARYKLIRQATTEAQRDAREVAAAILGAETIEEAQAMMREALGEGTLVGERRDVRIVDTIVQREALAQARAFAKGGPFRAPHFTAQPKALADEVRLAKGGVLYLHELYEFGARAIEAIARGVAAEKDVQLVVSPKPAAGDPASQYTLPRWEKHVAELRRGLGAAAVGEALGAGSVMPFPNAMTREQYDAWVGEVGQKAWPGYGKLSGADLGRMHLALMVFAGAARSLGHTVAADPLGLDQEAIINAVATASEGPPRQGHVDMILQGMFAQLTDKARIFVNKGTGGGGTGGGPAWNAERKPWDLLAARLKGLRRGLEK
jgi:hypothetical protein